MNNRDRTLLAHGPVPGIVRAVEGRRLARLDVEPSRRR